MPDQGQHYLDYLCLMEVGPPPVNAFTIRLVELASYIRSPYPPVAGGTVRTVSAARETQASMVKAYRK